MAQKPKPERADVVIIGAGASGATAAKVLTERGLKVVALERGPWRKRESFGGDELANVNRYNLWPDPILNPRTLRTSADEEPKLDLFCPVPQMVGGGTVHWQGWLPRFTESDFRLRSIVGDIPGTTLVDWPISYADLEPYYTEVEWAFGVSGAGGVNRFEGFRSKDYPCPPLPSTRYGEKFHAGCRKLGYNSFPTPMAALSRPYQRPAGGGMIRRVLLSALFGLLFWVSSRGRAAYRGQLLATSSTTIPASRFRPRRANGC